MSELGTATRPLRVAIVGSGPSGFYAAEALFKSKKQVQVDMFDRLPTPYGLVRGGVAPDHQKIKNVIRVYEKTAKTASFAFLGNVTVGRDILVEELRRHYDAILFTCGAETDRRLDVPGEDLPGSHTATEFVGWYNGHPDYRDRKFDLSGKVAVIIGQGNVAMDVSRILAKTTAELADTDIADYALDALARSSIERIYVAKFTPPEIKEIGELSDCDPVVKAEDLVLNQASQIELDAPESNHERKNFEIMREFSQRGAPAKRKRYHLEFLLGPVALRGDGRVQKLVLAKNRLTGVPFNQSAEPTGEEITIDCDILFRSVGYRGVALPGVPFDQKKGIFPNREGRILDGDREILGMYAAGWIKRGPSGIIGTNKPDSQATVDVLFQDLAKLTPCEVPDSQAVRQILRDRKVRVVEFADWLRIDAAEVERGKSKGKPREKFATVQEMLAVLDG
jgi:ferredoxin/flavodoxin---NADP+ reductase